MIIQFPKDCYLSYCRFLEVFSDKDSNYYGKCIVCHKHNLLYVDHVNVKNSEKQRIINCTDCMLDL